MKNKIKLLLNELNKMSVEDQKNHLVYLCILGDESKTFDNNDPQVLTMYSYGIKQINDQSLDKENHFFNTFIFY